MLDFIGFGAINLDTIYRVASLDDIRIEGFRLLPGRERSADSKLFSKLLGVVKRHGTLKAENGGGSAANTVVALSRMGFKTGYIGKVGHDRVGEKLRARMEGVDLRGVVSGGKSGRCLCILDANQDRFILLESNANDTLSAREIDFAYASQTHYIHFTSFVALKPLHAQRALLDRVAPPTRISFDPGEVYARRGMSHLKPLLEKSFVVFVTETETEMLTGLNPVDGSRRLLELGPAVLVCKRGERGVQVLSRDQEFDLPAEQTEVTDNTGAGDVFNAGFLAGLRLNRPLLDCARFGTRIAARSMRGYGRSQYPTREDLDFFQE